MKSDATSLPATRTNGIIRAGKGAPPGGAGKGAHVHTWGKDTVSTGKGGPTHPSFIRPAMAGKGGPTHPFIAKTAGKGGPIKPNASKPSVYVMRSSQDVLNALKRWTVSMGGH